MSVIPRFLLISLCHEWGGGCLPCRDGVCIDQAKVGHVCVCVCWMEGVLHSGLRLDQGTINTHPHPHESLGFSVWIDTSISNGQQRNRCLRKNPRVSLASLPFSVAYDLHMLCLKRSQILRWLCVSLQRCWDVTLFVLAQVSVGVWVFTVQTSISFTSLILFFRTYEGRK